MPRRHVRNEGDSPSLFDADAEPAGVAHSASPTPHPTDGSATAPTDTHGWMSDYELCANFWIVADEATGVVFRYGVRLYALAGSEETKLAALKVLASSDFLCARWFLVPTNSIVYLPTGAEARGAAPVSFLRSSPYREAAMEEAWRDLPPFYIVAAGEAAAVRLPLPAAVLWVETVLLEDASGAVRPVT